MAMVDGRVNGGSGVTKERAEEIALSLKFTEDEIGMLIYRFATGVNKKTGDYIWKEKKFNTPMKEGSKIAANIIFNNKREML